MLETYTPSSFIKLPIRLDLPVSTPLPLLQTPLFSSQSSVTASPLSTVSASSSSQENIPNVSVVYSGQPKQPSNSYPAQNNLLIQSVQQKNTPTSVPSTASYGPVSSNVQINQVSSSPPATTYNGRVSLGQQLSTSAATISTTTAPYSPSVPPFRSTSPTAYSPTATSYSQRTQSYNDKSRSYNEPSGFSNNQLQVLAKEYLPSSHNTRTARTNDHSFGSYGSAQRDSRQQFTYPVNQVN